MGSKIIIVCDDGNEIETSENTLSRTDVIGDGVLKDNLVGKQEIVRIPVTNISHEVMCIIIKCCKYEFDNLKNQTPNHYLNWCTEQLKNKTIDELTNLMRAVNYVNAKELFVKVIKIMANRVANQTTSEIYREFGIDESKIEELEKEAIEKYPWLNK